MATRSLIATVGVLLALGISCGRPGLRELPDPELPDVAAAATASNAARTEFSPAPAIVLDDAAISDFYRLVSPSGPIGNTDKPDLYSALLPDSIQPIYTPKFIGADQASFLEPEELVMGVDISGEARAYPVGLMRFREMANDTVGGVPILVTW